MSQKNQCGTCVNRISDIAIGPRDDQFLGRVRGQRGTASLERESPETPQNRQAADQPQWNGKEGENAGFYSRARAEKCQRDIKNEQASFKDEIEQGFKNGHSMLSTVSLLRLSCR